MSRVVTGIERNSKGEILSLLGPWGRLTLAQAVDEIEKNFEYYYILNGLGEREYLHVVHNKNRKTLSTGIDIDDDNSLQALSVRV